MWVFYFTNIYNRMASVQISNINGFTYPYTVYVCDVYSNYCVLLGVINSDVPPAITFELPPIFDNVPAVKINIVADNGCEHFEILNCVPQECCLLLQDDTCLLIQDNTVFLLQYC